LGPPPKTWPQSETSVGALRCARSRLPFTIVNRAHRPRRSLDSAKDSSVSGASQPYAPGAAPRRPTSCGYDAQGAGLPFASTPAAAFRGGTLARVGIFQVAQPVPHQAADGELVVEDSRSARSIAVDRAWTPGTAEWAGYLLSIEVLRRPRDRDRKQTSLSTGRAH
jgi:hypothetical protein